MSFAIITDSTSDISPARAQELGIYVIPLHVIIEGEDLLDQVQITAQEYVARMAGSEQLPHTSQPSAGEFKELFDRVRADGHDSAIFISLCSEWSACYANASLTAETHELDVRCIDSRTGSGAEGLLVEYALAMREDGRSLDETEAQIRATLPDAHLLLIPRTLENLVKNGRAPKLAGQLTQMLNIRLAVSPEWKSGEIKAIKKGRGAKRIVTNTMADCLAFLAEYPGSSVRVLTTGAAEEQELVNEALAGQDYVDAGTGPIGCTIATHVGVDAIAISYCPRYQPTHWGRPHQLRWNRDCFWLISRQSIPIPPQLRSSSFGTGLKRLVSNVSDQSFSPVPFYLPYISPLRAMSTASLRSSVMWTRSGSSGLIMPASITGPLSQSNRPLAVPTGQKMANMSTATKLVAAKSRRN